MNLIQKTLVKWGSDYDLIKNVSSICDVRLRQLPLIKGLKLDKDLLVFTDYNDTKYLIKCKNPFSKGTNGRVYETSLEKGQTGVEKKIVVKRMPVRLYALREALIQILAHQESNDCVAEVLYVFKTKHYLWIAMEDLRIPSEGAISAFSFHTWLHNVQHLHEKKNIASSIKDIVTRVVKLLNILDEKYAFKHGDLHLGNIYIHCSRTDIQRVILFDFGYSMIRENRNKAHSPSVYWKTRVEGADIAIFLWSLVTTDPFMREADNKLIHCIEQKLILANDEDMKKIHDITEMYQRIQKADENDMKPFSIKGILQEVCSLVP